MCPTKVLQSNILLKFNYVDTLRRYNASMSTCQTFHT